MKFVELRGIVITRVGSFPWLCILLDNKTHSNKKKKTRVQEKKRWGGSIRANNSKICFCCFGQLGKGMTMVSDFISIPILFQDFKLLNFNVSFHHHGFFPLTYFKPRFIEDKDTAWTGRKFPLKSKSKDCVFTKAASFQNLATGSAVSRVFFVFGVQCWTKCETCPENLPNVRNCKLRQDNPPPPNLTRK